MSAGICILNKHAVALAADSAVTIGQHLAIHNSANKLFALSRISPVGVIIYANAEFMNVPVEIIIKQYKEKNGNKSFPTLSHYVADFFEFLMANKALFHFDQNEKRFVKSIYQDLLAGLNGDYQRMVANKIKELQRDLTEDEIKELRNQAIDATKDFVEHFNPIPNFDVTDYVKGNYATEIVTYIKKAFDWATDEQIASISESVFKIYNKQFFRNGYVGFAFAGYGENDIFPCMLHLHLSGIINGKIRYIKKEQVEISETVMI